MAAQIEGNYKDGWQSMNEKERNVMADVCMKSTLSSYAAFKCELDLKLCTKSICFRHHPKQRAKTFI